MTIPNEPRPIRGGVGGDPRAGGKEKDGVPSTPSLSSVPSVDFFPFSFWPIPVESSDSDIFSDISNSPVGGQSPAVEANQSAPAAGDTAGPGNVTGTPDPLDWRQR